MAGSGRGNSGGGIEGQLIQIVIFIALPFLAGFALWMYAKPFVVFILYSMNVIQYAPFYYAGLLSNYSIGNFLHCIDALKWFKYPLFGVFPHGRALPAGIVDPSSITFQNLKIIQADIGSYMLLFYPIVVGCFWYIVNRDMLGDRLCRQFSLSGGKGKLSFMEYQSRHWTPTLFLNIFDHNERTYGDDAPLRIMEYLRINKVRLTREKGLDENRLESLMAEQIGPRWRGFDHEPFYIKAALLMAMATLQLDEDEINNIRSRLDRAFYVKNTKSKDEIETNVMAIVNDIIKTEPELVTVIEDVASSHAYTSTAVLAVFGYCGPFRNWNGGYGPMIPPPTYMWLMRYSRHLYLAMDGSIGKYGIIAFIEGAGIISHYQWERMTGKPKTAKYATSGVNGVKKWLEKEKIKDMAEFEKARANGLRRYRDRRDMAAAEQARITRILLSGKA